MYLKEYNYLGWFDNLELHVPHYFPEFFLQMLGIAVYMSFNHVGKGSDSVSVCVRL